MNVEVKYDRWTSNRERTELKSRADQLSEGNQRLHKVLDSVWKTMNVWAIDHVLDALHDGRITRYQVLDLYDRLNTVIEDTCMDTIPAPEE